MFILSSLKNDCEKIIKENKTWPNIIKECKKWVPKIDSMLKDIEGGKNPNFHIEYGQIDCMLHDDDIIDLSSEVCEIIDETVYKYPSK